MIYYGSEALARSARVVRKNTLVIAEEIPEEQYGFRPTPESRSVAEILSHVAVNTRASHQTHAVDRLTSFAGIDFAARLRTQQELERQLQTKTQIVEALRHSGDAWAAYLDRVTEADLGEIITFSPAADPPAKSRLEMILSVKEHEMHHRAQLMVIERLLGMVPHLTRQRQARARQAPSRPAGA